MSWYDTALAGWYRSKIASADALAAGIDKFASGLAQGIQGYKQNQMADQLSGQLMNTENPPRAGLVNTGIPGVSPQQYSKSMGGLPITGTAPAVATGGVQGLQMRLAIENLKRQQQNQASEIAMRNAQIPYYQAHTRYMNEQAASLPEYRAEKLRIREEQIQQKNQDSVEKMAKDIDTKYGKGSTTQIIQAINGTGGARGSIVNGKWIGDPNGPLWSASPKAQSYQGELSEQDAKPYMPTSVLDSYKERLDKIDNTSVATPSGGEKPFFQTPTDAAAAKAAGTIKPGDVIRTPNGLITVN